MISEKHARLYCYEDAAKIENYALAMADESQVWDLHHRLEITMNCGHKELKAKGCYYHRPAHELIFLTKAEHIRLHRTGKSLTDQQKAKISLHNNWRGTSGPMGGKKHTKESRAKISHASSLRGKKVQMMCDNGLTMTFDKITHAAVWLRNNGYPKASQGGVSQCVSGKVKKMYGARWRRV